MGAKAVNRPGARPGEGEGGRGDWQVWGWSWLLGNGATKTRSRVQQYLVLPVLLFTNTATTNTTGSLHHHHQHHHYYFYYFYHNTSLLSPSSAHSLIFTLPLLLFPPQAPLLISHATVIIAIHPAPGLSQSLLISFACPAAKERSQTNLSLVHLRSDQTSNGADNGPFYQLWSGH